MAKRSKALLKEAFVTLKTPSESDFSDLIDSVVHLDDQTAVDAQIVNQAINAYNTALTGKTPNGTVDSLGDVYGAFEGIDDATKLVDIIKWSGLPGKPATVDLDWSEQLIVTDTTKFDPQPRETPTPGTTQTNPAQKFILTDLGLLSGKFTIVDLKVERRWISIPTGGTPITFYTDVIVAVKVAVSLKAKLT